MSGVVARESVRRLVSAAYFNTTLHASSLRGHLDVFHSDRHIKGASAGEYDGGEHIGYFPQFARSSTPQFLASALLFSALVSGVQSGASIETKRAPRSTQFTIYAAEAERSPEQ